MSSCGEPSQPSARLVVVAELVSRAGAHQVRPRRRSTRGLRVPPVGALRRRWPALCSIAIGRRIAMTTEALETDLRTIATRRVRAKREFYMHASTYLIVNLALAGVWLLTGGGYPWFLWPLIGWGTGVLFHGFALVFRVDGSSPATAADEQAIEREIARMRRTYRVSSSAG